MLEAHRDSNGSWTDPCRYLLLGEQADVGGGRRVGHQGLGATQRGGQPGDASGLHKATPGFEASLQREPNLVERLVDLMESRQHPEEGPTETRRELARQAWVRQIRTWFGIGG